jgi:hypothetical protein
VEGVPLRIKVTDNRVETPVPILIDDVAAIAVGEKFGVEPAVIGPRFRVRADAIEFEFELRLNVGAGFRLVHMPTIAWWRDAHDDRCYCPRTLVAQP